MLASPTLRFTIPSQRDGVALECRIYHPRCLSVTSFEPTNWNRKVAIIAHPYAALGGCMDDPVVSLIAAICLGEGFVVGTFNFRGATGSEGRTSWQSRSEQDDYMSFIGFVIYYLHYLYTSLLDNNKVGYVNLKLSNLNSAPPQDLLGSQFQEGIPSNPDQETELPRQQNRGIRLLLGGYSYGSLITMALPATIQSIMEPFREALVGSNYVEIRRRAEFFAEEQSLIIKNQLPQDFGVEHTESIVGPKLTLSRPETKDLNTTSVKTNRSEGSSKCAQLTVDDIKVAYLLVSPLCGIVSNLLTMWTFNTRENKSNLSEKSKKLQRCPTLAVFGDDDVFVSVENLRSWAECLSKGRSSDDKNHFRFKEIPGASHFWRDRQSIEILKTEVKIFVRSL